MEREREVNIILAGLCNGTGQEVIRNKIQLGRDGGTEHRCTAFSSSSSSSGQWAVDSGQWAVALQGTLQLRVVISWLSSWSFSCFQCPVLRLHLSYVYWTVHHCDS